MKNILCFGDSNTWGGCDEGDRLVRFEERWTKLLKKKLGDEFNVYEEGLNGRTLDSCKPEKPWIAGCSNLYLSLETHFPLDLVIVMLGTNDLFTYFSNSVKQVGQKLEKLIKIIQTYKFDISCCPQILIITPPKLNAVQARRFFEVDDSSQVKSIALEKEYETIAKKNKCLYISALDLPVGSDGLHLMLESHKILADRIYSILQ